MDNRLPIPKPRKSKTTTSEIVKVLILALVSFLAGFALIYFFLRPSAPEVAPDELPHGDNNALLRTDADTPDTPAVATASTRVKRAKEAPVPPGETPDGVTQDGEPHYLKCWDKTGIESDGDRCDRLLKLENRFTERLYVVNDCKNQEAGSGTQGKLVVACEVNFDNNTVSFWNAPASELRNSSDIGDCLRNELAGLPIEAIDHAFSRYRIYFTVDFGKPVRAAVAVANSNNGDSATMDFTASSSAPPPGAGRMVDVIKDRVRVRKAPVNGKTFGKISSGNQVRLLKQENDWCNVVTPNNNEGWMTCSALKL